MLLNDLFLLASDVRLEITFLGCYPDSVVEGGGADKRRKHRAKQQVEVVRTWRGRSGLCRRRGNAEYLDFFCDMQLKRSRLAARLLRNREGLMSTWETLRKM